MILGQTVVKQLFQGEDPVGATIRVKNAPFLVIGVLAAKGSSAMGRDQDDMILMPMTTARGYIVGKSQVQADQVGQIYIKFDAGADLKDAQEEIETLLRQRRRIQPGGEDNFNVRNLAEFMKARTEVSEHDDISAGGDVGDIPDCRRNWHYEHYARIGD